MIARTLLLSCIALALACGALAAPDLHWSLFKTSFKKKYQNPLEESVRREIFARNKAHIEEFNAKEADEAGFRLGLNHMSDWTPEEFNKINGLRLTEEHLLNSQESQTFLDDILADKKPVPDELDWRKVDGCVAPVKNQGSK